MHISSTSMPLKVSRFAFVEATKTTRWNFNEQILTKFQRRVSCLCAQSALPPFRVEGCVMSRWKNKQRRRMQFSFTSPLFHSQNSPYKRVSKDCTEVDSLFHCFCAFFKLPPRGVWVKALEKLWNQVKLHILPPPHEETEFPRMKSAREAENNLQALWRLCLPSSARQWVGRQAHVSALPPRKKRVPFCLTLYLRALQELACLEAFFICVFLQGILCARGGKLK